MERGELALIVGVVLMGFIALLEPHEHEEPGDPPTAATHSD